VGVGGKFEVVSRESFLLSNNVLLTVAAASVLLGTLYPLLVDALGGAKLSVGPPYFNLVFVPLMAPAMFLMGVGPIARWKKASLPDLVTRLRWAFVISVLSAIVLPFILGGFKWRVSLGLLLAVWILTTILVNLWERVRVTSGQLSTFQKLRSQSRSYYGMQLAHLGVAVFVVGVTLVTGYQTEQDVRMTPGDVVTAGRYSFRFNGVTKEQGPNYVARRAEMVVSYDGTEIEKMFPEKRRYPASGSTMTETAIDSGIFRHLYISLGEQVSDDAWSVRVYYKPFIGWIWFGAVLMALGGGLAVSDRRYALAARKEREAREMSKPAEIPSTVAASVTE
jgi:cytochrome c-type biogenesis protein CcmF